jgi:hypothetical protein
MQANPSSRQAFPLPTLFQKPESLSALLTTAYQSSKNLLIVDTPPHSHSHRWLPASAAVLYLIPYTPPFFFHCKCLVFVPHSLHSLITSSSCPHSLMMSFANSKLAHRKDNLSLGNPEIITHPLFAVNSSSIIHHGRRLEKCASNAFEALLIGQWRCS